MKKNAIDSSKNAIANPAKENQKELIKFNLDQFADQLSGMQLKEKKDRETIYLYPEGFSKSDIGSEKGKKYRNSLRNQIKRFSNNILIFAKIKDEEKLKIEIAKFDEFYQKNYRNCDYSLGSISQSKDASKEKDFDLFLQIIKSCK